MFDTVPPSPVDGMTQMYRPVGQRYAPSANAKCPPTPATTRGPIVCTPICPLRSIRSAPLIATKFSLRAITVGSSKYSTFRIW